MPVQARTVGSNGGTYTQWLRLSISYAVTIVARFTLTVATLTLLLISLFPQAVVHAEDVTKSSNDTFFYLDGKKIHIRLQKERIAVQLKNETTEPNLFSLVMQRHGDFTTSTPLETFPDQGIEIVGIKEFPSSVSRQFAVQNLVIAEPDIAFLGEVATVQETNRTLVIRNRVVARLKSSVNREEALNIIENIGLRVLEESKYRPGRLLLEPREATPKSIVQLANELYESGVVEYSHPDYFGKTEKRTGASPIPNDPLFSELWHLENNGGNGGMKGADVHILDAWSLTRGEPSVLVAVLDDGIALDHEDLKSNLLPCGKDLANDPRNDDPSPKRSSDNHGTAVAGLIGASVDNGVGVAGVCPQCRLLPVKILGGTGSSQGSHASGFDFAMSKGVDVINASWGYNLGTPGSSDLKDAIREVAKTGRKGLGTPIIFAMSNADVDDCAGATGFPDISSLPEVIAVSASTNLDKRVLESGHGECMSVLAPSYRGQRDPYNGTLNVTTADRPGLEGYNSNVAPPFDCPVKERGNLSYTSCFGGTSAAAPVVAGIVGLMLSINPSLNSATVKKILQETADKIEPIMAKYDAKGFSKTHGYGRVNAGKAVMRAKELAVNQPQKLERGRTCE